MESMRCNSGTLRMQAMATYVNTYFSQLNAMGNVILSNDAILRMRSATSYSQSSCEAWEAYFPSLGFISSVSKMKTLGYMISKVS